ncbi:hypothetical protein FVEG_15762 [Fusarium verticillioides 7600]|uniref:Uncharacterized protein n=1 Tax=Gibberella moniliformis (strain M3125 / FGSC 7600) TaxID=334819 RepID=W7MBM6_GIBM7|nr:hypothetical protein FVEG_15762 [Fusarium verticillioides 7600]EWG44964.1 hypothetical protein FVEG_15762 [Fusarium verticillioides 7600]
MVNESQSYLWATIYGIWGCQSLFVSDISRLASPATETIPTNEHCCNCGRNRNRNCVFRRRASLDSEPGYDTTGLVVTPCHSPAPPNCHPCCLWPRL